MDRKAELKKIILELLNEQRLSASYSLYQAEIVLTAKPETKLVGATENWNKLITMYKSQIKDLQDCIALVESEL